MNHKLHLKRTILMAVVQLTGALLLSGCINLPPQVKDSVDNTRDIINQLHAAHAQDVRAFARFVEKRETDEKALREAVHREAQARAMAEVERFKAKTMADFDRCAADLLGIQFLDKVERDIVPKFYPLEKTCIEELADGEAEKVALPNDPGTAEKITTAERNLTDLQCQRSSTVIGYYLALNASIVKTRFNFETQVAQRYDEELKTFMDAIKADPGAEAALANFQKRTDTNLEQLDMAYYSVDHALSDISTFLDGESTARRFSTHFFKGFASALVDDLSSGQLGGTQLTGSLEDKINEFTKNLAQAGQTLQEQAKTTVATAASSLPTVPPPVTTALATQPKP